LTSAFCTRIIDPLRAKTVRLFSASARARVLADWLIGAGLFLGSFLLYLRTLAPSVATIFDDSLEFQLVCYQPGIAHPPGYPLYTLLGKLFTFLPFGDVAYRVNLMSAVFGSLTVALAYATLRQLTSHRLPAVLGAAVLAVSPVFWSQAVIAEVYTLNAAFVMGVLGLLLAWARRQEDLGETGDDTSPTRARLLTLAALLYGLSLAHHRTMVLLAFPALLFVALVDRRIFKDRGLMARLAVLVIAPLALYLYLPLRGMTMSSLNGVYQNTPGGFLSYVTAASYGVFLGDNPLAQSYDLAFYVALLREQFTWAGVLLAIVGMVWSFRKWPVGLLLTIFALITTLFAVAYQVPDVQVFLIPLFLVCALWIGLGFSASWDGFLALWRRRSRPRLSKLPQILYTLLFVAGLLLPCYLWRENFVRNDLSDRWGVHEYGTDMLSPPLEEDAVVVGILGEITLLNYFQQTEALRPDLATIAADTEEERLSTVTAEMKRGHTVYLTRPLSGIEELYHLSSLGPLVQVRERPAAITSEPSHPLSLSFGEAILLRGYDSEIRETKVGPQLRLSLHWLAAEQIAQDYKVSLRFLNDEGHLAAVHDSYPVGDAYRTDAWKPGEVILDTHDLPILAGVPPGDYIIQVTMYDPDVVDPLASASVGSVVLQPTLGLDGAGPWDVGHKSLVNLGGRIKVLGYSVIGESFQPGDRVPLTFLWQALDQSVGGYTLFLWLDGDGTWPGSEVELPLSGRYPPDQWQKGELVRDWESFLIPGNVENGSYHLRLQVRHENQALPGLLWRLPTENVLDLGQLQVEGRERSFDVPSLENPLEAQLGESVRLLGYNLEPTGPHPGEMLHLTLYWQSAALMDTSYTVFVHLLDEDGQIRAQGDGPPGSGALPTTGWAEGEVVTDGHEVSIPLDAQPGRYSIVVGMYDAATGVRLPVFEADGGSTGDRIFLGHIELTEG
jgi:hypothetical protein